MNDPQEFKMPFSIKVRETISRPQINIEAFDIEGKLIGALRLSFEPISGVGYVVAFELADSLPQGIEQDMLADQLILAALADGLPFLPSHPIAEERFKANPDWDRQRVR